MMGYPNVSELIGSVISTGLATMTELGETLSTEDAHDLIEIAAINSYNSRPRQ